MSSPLGGGALAPPVYDPYAIQVGNLSESIHMLLTEREGRMFDSALATYHRRRDVKLFIEVLALVLNTNAKRQLLIPIRDAYIKASDVTRFNELAVSRGLAATLTNRRKKTKGKAKDGVKMGSPLQHPGAVMVDIKRDSKGETGFTVRGGSESGIGVFVSWINPGSSADKSGLQVGDQILKINETSFESISHYDAIEVMNDTSSKKLRLWVLPNAKVPSSRTAHMAFTWVDSEGRHTSPPVPEEQQNERMVRLLVTKGRDLGISIRGGAEYGLGIYISVVEEGSVAWEEGLKKGDQILEINGQSFRNIRHADAVRVLRSNHTLVLKLRDVGKLPYTKILPYNDKKWHSSQGSTFPRTAQSQNSESPVLLKKHEGRVSPARDVMESLAMTVLTQAELTAFKKLVYQYKHQDLHIEDFAKELLKLLNQPEKLRLLSEVKAIITPDDLNRFNELTVRKELQAKKAMKANGSSSYAEVVSHTLPKQSNKGSKTHKYQLYVGDDDDDDDDDDDHTGPLNGYMSEDLEEPEARASSRAMRAAGSLDDIPQRLSPSGVPTFLKPPPPPALFTSRSEDPDIDMPLVAILKDHGKRIQHKDSENANAEEDNPMSTQWSESSLQSGFSKDTGHDPSEIPTLKGIRRWTEDGEAPAAAAAIEAKVRSETELKLRKEFEEKERMKSEELRKQLLEEQQRKEEAIKAEKEALQKKIKEVEENAKREAEAQLRQQLEEREKELITKAQQEQQEKLQAERKAAEVRVREAEERAKKELEQKAWKEAEERLKAEYETRMAHETAKLKESVAKSGEVEKKVRQELEAKLQQEYDQKLEQELKKRAKQDEEGKNSREQGFLLNKSDEVARLEAEEEARMAMEERIRREAEAKIRAEYEARLQRETQEKVRLAEEIKIHKAAEARLQNQEAGDQQRKAGPDVPKKTTEKKPKTEGMVVEPLRKLETNKFDALKKPTEKKPKEAEEVAELVRNKRPDQSEGLELQVKAAEEDQKQREQLDAAQQKKDEEEARKKEEEKRRKEELQRKREENLRKRDQEKKVGGVQQEGKKSQLQQAKWGSDVVKVQTEPEMLQMEAPPRKDEQEKVQRERAEQEKAERERAGQERADQELIKRQKADKERAEQREKVEQERAEQRQKAERERVEQREKEERERVEREKVEREKVEREKTERIRAEQRQKAEREKAEQEQAELERAQRTERERVERIEQEKAERERVRQEELKLLKERAEAERNQKELQEVAEQKRQAAEERMKAENTRKAAFNVKREPVNFGADAPAIKTKQQLIEEERLMAEDKLQKKLLQKAKQQQSEVSSGGVQLRVKNKPAPKVESAVPKLEPATPKAGPVPKTEQTEPIPKVGSVPKTEPISNAEAIPHAGPLEETDFVPTTGGFSFAGYDNLHGKLDTIKVVKFTKKLGISIDGGANTKQKAVLIREIMPDGCATESNLHVGQQILQVNGHSVYGLKHRDVVMNIKEAFEGPLNKTIEFVVLSHEAAV